MQTWNKKVVWTLGMLIVLGGGILNGAVDPKTYKPPQYPEAENHLRVPFLPEARDWERLDIYVPKVIVVVEDGSTPAATDRKDVDRK